MDLADRRRRVASEDDGSASLEFTFLGVLILVPLTYVLLAVFAVQNAANAATTATREAARAVVTTRTGDPQARGTAAARLALKDHGLTLGREELRIRCSSAGCDAPGTSVTTQVTRLVPLPFVPSLFDKPPAAIRINVTHRETVGEHRSKA